MVFAKGLGRGALACVLLVLTACATRSISDSGYREPGHGGNPAYHGELSEYDVLGIDPAGRYSDADIQKAMVERRPLSVRKGSGILLIQSGAEMADPEMIAAVAALCAAETACCPHARFLLEVTAGQVILAVEAPSTPGLLDTLFPASTPSLR